MSVRRLREKTAVGGSGMFSDNAGQRSASALASLIPDYVPSMKSLGGGGTT